MLNESERAAAVAALVEARNTRTPCVQLSTTWPHITIEDAYAISTTVAEQRMAEGARLAGYKVGLTSKAMQASSRIDEPDYGHVLDDMLLDDGAVVRHADYCVPRVELGTRRSFWAIRR